MTNCIGTFAERYAVPYIEGTLPEFEVERFEEHYFDCPVCLAHLQAIQAVSQELARQPVTVPAQPHRKMPLTWTRAMWTAGAAAALLLVSFLSYKGLESKPGRSTDLQSQQKSLPQEAPHAQQSATPVVPLRVSQLADFASPAFVASSLRGENPDAGFEAGMKEYSAGDYRRALTILSKVPAESAEARAARFYSGVCQMRLGNYASASELLRNVADAGDSPQQEAALYELAQIALAENDPVAAHAYLNRTISLRGDFEQRAREQGRRIAKLTEQDSQERPLQRPKPETK
ncbi:MAG: tetratricopeptide repeat protein [Terracidiphilus sp.]|jgi:tetratricopeptide (TPR) repeat protein